MAKKKTVKKEELETKKQSNKKTVKKDTKNKKTAVKEVKQEEIKEVEKEEIKEAKVVEEVVEELLKEEVKEKSSVVEHSKEYNKADLFKWLGGAFLLLLVLTWIIKAGAFSSGTFVLGDTEPLGLLDIVRIPLATFTNYFTYSSTHTVTN